ncbi:hypothetical protein GCM10009549_41710 [Streptomyces thermoalcalitolerans]|uniref:Uncharacterized protein n=1 Tax=Streptomyces thermoalcalitolerans TaxID=65605 RepID=A0ABN1P4B2_9ACTN
MNRTLTTVRTGMLPTGAAVHGWTPGDERVHAEAVRQMIAFTADDAVRDRRRMPTSSRERIGGGS